MPLQNRVTPFNELEATPTRGSLMGNRGILHDETRAIGRAKWTHKRWIACSLTYKTWRRVPMSPRRYTELFFLDEVTSLAAGHRPCKLCRRPAYLRFEASWRRAHAIADGVRLSADDIDDGLHVSRVDRKRFRRHDRALGGLPDGVFVVLYGQDTAACLLWQDQLHRWSHDGYGARRSIEADRLVTVLTPAATVAVLRAGYAAEVDPRLG